MLKKKKVCDILAKLTSTLQTSYVWLNKSMNRDNHTSPSLENAKYKQPQFLEPRGLNPQMLKQYSARKVFPLQNLSKENILKIYVII